MPRKIPINKHAVRKAIKGLPCRLNYGRLFGKTQDENGTLVESTCALGYLLEMAGAERKDYAYQARNTAPIGDHYHYDRISKDNLAKVQEKFGFTINDLSRFLLANDGLKARGYKAAHQRCLTFKEQLTNMLLL